jgi:hypothetical protein
LKKFEEKPTLYITFCYIILQKFFYSFIVSLKINKMAKVEKNVLTRGLSGKLGNQVVFRIRGSNTLMAVAPGRRTKPPTDAQLEQQQRFREAVICATSVMNDPVLKEDYKVAAKGDESAFISAVADFLKGPRIIEVDSDQYAGEIGSTIRVGAIDNFKLVSVSVGIFKADNSLVESGAATPDTNGLDWLYTATQHNAEMTGGKIVATATDTPGHQVDMTMLL